MRETITMSSTEQRRALVLTKVLVGELTGSEAAELLGVSLRTVRRLCRALRLEGPAGLVHGNRGRASPHRLPEPTRARILELAATRYAGANDCHLAELLAEAEDIVISRASLRRLLRSAGCASPRRRRAPRHRSRRDRMPQAGLLLQTDGSRHDWLGERGPRLTLVGAIDDATGVVTAATFREQEDSAGYLTVLRDTVRRYGLPAAIYHDRHGIFETPEGRRTLQEELADERRPTQFGRALAELGIGSIAARSPRAKGRIERLWGTLQDRLVLELRIAGAADRAAAEALLPRFLASFNRRFKVPPQDPRPAWRPVPHGVRLDHVCSHRYRRTVAHDGTIRAGATVLQLPARANGRSRAGQRVELQLRLDGRLAVWDGEREILATAAPLDAVQLRALHIARADIGALPPSSATALNHPNHPWRVGPGSRFHQQRLTESLSR
jgi:transposase